MDNSNKRHNKSSSATSNHSTFVNINAISTNNRNSTTVSNNKDNKNTIVKRKTITNIDLDKEVYTKEKITGELYKLKTSGCSIFSDKNLRFFDLDFKRQIFGYKVNQRDTYLKEYITLTDFQLLTPELNIAQKRRFNSEYGFYVKFKNREFVLFAPNAYEYEKWTEAFSRVNKIFVENKDIKPSAFQTALDVFAKPHYDQLHQQEAKKLEEELKLKEEQAKAEAEALAKREAQARLEEEIKLKQIAAAAEEEKRKTEEANKLKEIPIVMQQKPNMNNNNYDTNLNAFNNAYPKALNNNFNINTLNCDPVHKEAEKGKNEHFDTTEKFIKSQKSFNPSGLEQSNISLFFFNNFFS